MQLPGGATLNGRQIYDDGNTEVEKLEEESQMRYQLPDNFYVGLYYGNKLVLSYI